MTEPAPIGAPSPREIAHLLSSRRLPLGDEKRLQVAMATEFENMKWSFAREFRLTPLDIVDFMVGTVAVEVKISGSKREIFRQLERYCQRAEVTAIVLATNVPMGLPPDICGKPTAIALLGRGWL